MLRPGLGLGPETEITRVPEGHTGNHGLTELGIVVHVPPDFEI